MKIFNRVCLLLLLLAFGYAPQALASQCALPGASINTKQGFCVSFTLDSNGTNRLRLEHDGRYYPLWTDDDDYWWYSPAIFERDYVGQGKERAFQIKFTPTSNVNARWIIGTLQYYVDGVLKWTDPNFDLSAATDADKFNPYVVFNLIGSAGTPDDFCVTAGDCVEKPNYSTNATYEFGVAHCDSMPCTIPFHKDYKFTPLVFVMPTIDDEEQDEDAPSRLYVASELTPNSTSVTIDQDSLPNLSNSFKTVPMRSISYLIIEPGTASIGNHQVVAGYVNTNKFRSKNGSTGDQSVSYSSFGGGDYGDNPVVLHQIQTRNNAGYWMTSGRYWDNSSNLRGSQARLFLELSASRDRWHSYRSEKIAFLATKTSNVLETDDYYLQFKNDFETVQQSSDEPMEDGCEERFARTNLTRVDGVIAKKQERAGGHGGWIRTCKKQGHQFSVVVDEDYRVRSHIPERVGYLAFERKKLKFDHCDFFPQPAQGWMPGSKVAFSNYKQKTPYPYFIGGWSDTYIQNNLNGGLLTIPFDSVSHSGSDPISCEAGRCSAGGYNPDITILDVSPAYPTSGVLNIDPSNYKALCPTDGSGKYCRSSSDNKNIYITITSNLKSLSVAGSRAVKMHVNFTTDVTEYGRVIGTYFVNQHVHTTFNNSGTYTFGEFITTGQTALTIGKKIVWKIGKVLYFGNPVDLTSTEITDDFVIYAPDAVITFNKMSEDFYALILAKKIMMTNQMILHGAVTTNDLLIQNGKTTILGQSQCFNPPIEEVARIEIKPFNYHLTCEASPQNIVEVHVFDKDGKPVAGKQPTLREASGNNLSITALSQSDSDGVATYRVVKNNQSQLGSYTLTASLPTGADGTVTDTAQIHYVPYKFEVADIKTVAGKKTKFDISVKACDANNQLIDLGYKGTPSATFSYVRPITTPIASDLIVQADLDDGKRDAELTFMESGSITVALEDKQFVCDDERCPIVGGSLKGEFSVDARPYKIAICDVKQLAQPQKLNPATTTGMPGFISSGSAFSVTYVPIVHPDSKGNIATNNECAYPITGNYALDKGELKLTHDVVYPTVYSTLGILTPESIPSFNSSKSTLTLTHSWDDVGTIALKTGANYLGMDLDADVQNVGRFYPSSFVIDQSDWNAPQEQGDVTYLSQPFDKVEIGVAALNINGDKVKNYHHFASDLRAKFAIKQDSKVDNKLRIEETGHWQANTDGTSGWKLIDDNAAVMRHEVKNSGAVITTKENGPFNIGGETTDYGLTISGVDPVSFDADSQQTEEDFASQPKVQYGRMVMGSLGGVSGSKFTIPLRIEYWDGNRFALNTLDDRTLLTDDAQYLCKQTIWPTTGSDSDSKLVLDDGVNKVVDGVSTGLEAWAADNVRREQVRFWMQLDDMTDSSHSSPHLSRVTGCGTKGLDEPWLQYNWQGEGDEDPSTVVTFGIYRGSDKIIFRGEAGLTGQ